MSSLRTILLCLAVLCGAASGALAQGLTALARVDAGEFVILDDGPALIVDLALSQPVPWRAYTLDAPRRLVIDFSEARFDGPLPTATTRIGTITTGPLQPGWSRMVVELHAPLSIAEAGLDTSAPGRPRAPHPPPRPGDEAEFAAASGVPPDLAQTLPQAVIPAPRRNPKVACASSSTPATAASTPAPSTTA